MSIKVLVIIAGMIVIAVIIRRNQIKARNKLDKIKRSIAYYSALNNARASNVDDQMSLLSKYIARQDKIHKTYANNLRKIRLEADKLALDAANAGFLNDQQ